MSTGAGSTQHDEPLTSRLARRDTGLLLFGITPPRESSTYDDRQWVADITLERLQEVNPDGLVLYDIADEADRNTDERPFPYLPTVDPAEFVEDHLAAWAKPVIVYRCVGKYTRLELETWLSEQQATKVATVFVGAPSRTAATLTDLPEAQALRSEVRPDLLLGGVAIPERHSARQSEHHRLIRKQERGCSFFITQVVYDVNAAKSLVSDYYYRCVAIGIEPVPMIFTLSVCGSTKTLQFLRWLGVDVPRWMENALAHATDTLAVSYDQCVATADDLASFCQRLHMPYGFNVESVSSRRDEIETTVDLAAQLRRQLDENTCPAPPTSRGIDPARPGARRAPSDT